MGKGWSKGLTAATDPRVARAAAAHRGLRYERRTPYGWCKWPVASRTTLPLEWSNAMAYVVGLTATDGCLITGRRKINFKSGDRDLVEKYLALLGRSNRVKEQRTRTGGVAYFTEFYDAQLYEWFLSIGLMPRKSLVLGALSVPDEYLLPLARGLLDGDGSVLTPIHRPTRRTYPAYLYERLWVHFNSASRTHVEWLCARIEGVLGLTGYIETLRAKKRPRPMYRLKYGNQASAVLLPALYSARDVPRLERKWRKWADYAVRHNIATDHAELLQLGFSPT